MSASPAQIAANRANARHSTGPRTVEGKAASARNALSHGIHASDDTILAAPDSPAAAYLADFTAELAPAGPLEAALVRQLAVLAARTDLLDRALDTFPRLNQRRALIDCLQDQYDVFGPSAQLRDQPEWSATLRRYDGCPATYPRDPDPSTDPDLAACTLVYSLTSPRYGKLLRQHAQAQRGFRAALADVQRLQAARPKATPSHPAIPAHLQAISDLLDGGWQFLPPDHPTSIARNEPNAQPNPSRTDPAPFLEQNEPKLAPVGSLAPRARVAVERPTERDAALEPARTGQASITVWSENEANSTPDPSGAPLPTGPAESENGANATSTPAGANLADVATSSENEANSDPRSPTIDLSSRATDPAVVPVQPRRSRSRSSRRARSPRHARSRFGPH